VEQQPGRRRVLRSERVDDPWDRIASCFSSDGPTEWSDLATESACRAFQDTVACALAGTREPVVGKLVEMVSPWGGGEEVAVFGTPHRMPSPWAALVNGTAAHSLEYDDVVEVAQAHVSAVLVPAVLAVGEARGASGTDCLDAYLIGFEVMALLGERLNDAHYYLGWHPTSTLGAIGAAASCARLMRLEPDHALGALSLATSMAAGLKRQFGSLAKPVHAGLAAKNGVIAAAMAAQGVSAAKNIFTGPRGFLDCYGDPSTPMRAWTAERTGSAIETFGIWTKAYPCCASTHRPVDAVMYLQRSHGFGVHSVAQIDAQIPEIAFQNLPFDQPRNSEEARFSLHFCLAAALLKGELSLASFDRTAMSDPEVARIMSRISVEIHPDQVGMASRVGEDPSATVVVRLADGNEVSHSIQYPKGHPKAPLSRSRLLRKFVECTHAVLGSRSREVFDTLGDLSSVRNVRQVVSGLKP